MAPGASKEPLVEESTSIGRAVALPELDAAPGEWHQALHLDNDNEDCVDEYWYHYAGCECWIRLRRNLSSHDFIDADHATSEVAN